MPTQSRDGCSFLSSGPVGSQKTVQMAKEPDIFTKIQWYAFQTAVLIVFLVTLYKFVRSLL